MGGVLLSRRAIDDDPPAAADTVAIGDNNDDDDEDDDNVVDGPHRALGGVRSAHPPCPTMLRSPGTYKTFSNAERFCLALGTGDVAA